MIKIVETKLDSNADNAVVSRKPKSSVVMGDNLNVRILQDVSGRNIHDGRFWYDSVTRYP